MQLWSKKAINKNPLSFYIARRYGVFSHTTYDKKRKFERAVIPDSFALRDTLYCKSYYICRAFFQS